MDYYMRRDMNDPGVDREYGNAVPDAMASAGGLEGGVAPGYPMDEFMSGSVFPTASQQDVYSMDERYFMEQGHIMDPGCFDKSSAMYGEQIKEFINDEFSDSLYYKSLAKKARSNSARKTLERISGEETRHARTLSGIYFLLTGVRYYPTTATVKPPVIPASYMQALRERYIAESRGAIAYLRFAQSVTDDVCLKRVAQNLSEDERRHAQEIMGLIQSA